MPPIRFSASNKTVCLTDGDDHLVCSSTHTLTLSKFLTLQCSRKNPAVMQLPRKAVKQLVLCGLLELLSKHTAYFSFLHSAQPSQLSLGPDVGPGTAQGLWPCHVYCSNRSFTFPSSVPTSYVAHNKYISLPHLSPAFGAITPISTLHICGQFGFVSPSR